MAEWRNGGRNGGNGGWNGGWNGGMAEWQNDGMEAGAIRRRDGGMTE